MRMKNWPTAAAALLVGTAVAAAQSAVTTSGGTANSVPKFSGASTIVNSAITEVSGKVGVGTASPTQTLDVRGNVTFGVSGSSNTMAYKSLQTGTDFTFLTIAPQQAGADNTSNLVFTSERGIVLTSTHGMYIKSLQNPGGITINDFNTATFTSSGPYGIPLVIAGASAQTADLLDVTSNANSILFNITGSGNAGLGTSAPGAKLEVNGNLKLTSGSGASIMFADGSVQTTAWNGVLSGGDYAESVDVTGDRKLYESGDVLVVDPSSDGRFVKSSKAYSTTVMGIYSTNPGAVGRRQKSDCSHMAEEVPMAMIGIVPTKVTGEGGPIKPGDLLVTSSRPGYAMKGSDRRLLTGAIIGKALGHLSSGIGVIEVAVSLQ